MASRSMSRWKRKSAGSATSVNALASARKWACASGAGRCIPPAALQLEGQPGVVRPLIRPGESRQRRIAVLDVRIGQLEAVEAAARHEKQLIAAHVTGRAQLAVKFPLLA